MATNKKIFVLDTNVLIHDPTAPLRFGRHDVVLPIAVLEELDTAKVGVSEVARNVREVSRILDGLIERSDVDTSQGVALPSVDGAAGGRLYFYSQAIKSALPEGLARNSCDNTLLGITLDLSKTHRDSEVTLISKDINLRIKAHALNIRAEDYTNDQVLDDTELLYTGMAEFDRKFWDKLDGANQGKGSADAYTIPAMHVNAYYPNQFLYPVENTAPTFMVRHCADGAVLEVIKDYTQAPNSVWGIHARNREQNFALNLLVNPDIDFVTLLGQAGTGKTLLTLASALVQTLEEKRYSEIVMTRATLPVGEDIGFLPGTEEEKMGPWMGALEDNLDVLHETGGHDHGAWDRAVTHEFIRNRIHIKSLNFMRGRTFLRKFIIIDDAQNLSPHQVKTLITRAGPGSKIVCLGTIAQIDTPYLTETTSGLTCAVDRFKGWAHSGHVTLQRGERSRLADYASEML